MSEQLLLSLKEVTKLLGVSTSSLYRLRVKGLFTPAYYAKKWARQDIELWQKLGMPSECEFVEHKKLLCKKHIAL